MKPNKKPNKKTIFVQPVYTIVTWVIALLLIIIILFLPSILQWDRGDKSEVIMYYGLFSIVLLIALIALLYYIQVAILSDEGVLIKNIFGKIVFIEWSAITDISIQELIYDPRYAIKKKWIVLKTDNSQIAHKSGVNRRKKGPWQIKATTKNIDAIKQYYEKDIRFETEI